MKKLLLVAAATVALSACGSKSEPAPEPVETADTSLQETATGDVTGDYEIKMADGTITRQRINPDGTYTDTDANGTQTEKGTWRQQGTQMCFDPDGAEPETCYSGGAPSDDGSFEMRDPDGSVTSTVRKIEVQTGANTAPAE